MLTPGMAGGDPPPWRPPRQVLTFRLRSIPTTGFPGLHRPMRRTLTLLAVLAVAGAAAWWLWPRPPVGAPAAQARASTAVETATAEERDVTPTLEAPGTLRANEDVVLRPEISGRVSAIRFEEGQHVQRGAVLVQLDDSVYRAEVDKARVNLELADRNFDRARDLLERKLGSVRDSDIARAALDSAEAELALARARLDKTRILAPFDGLAGLRDVSPGDYVAPGQDLVRVVDLDTIKVDFRLPEVALPLVEEARQVVVLPDALPGETLAGEVYAMEPAVTEAGRSLTLRARVANPGARLKPGMFARVRLTAGSSVRGIVIPEAAVIPGSDGPEVFRVTAGRAERVAVALGQRGPGWVQVTDGLSAGDAVVVAGQEKLRAGSPVTEAGGG